MSTGLLFVKPVDHRNDCIFRYQRLWIDAESPDKNKGLLDTGFYFRPLLFILPTSSEVKFFTLNRTSESISIRLVFKNQSLSI